MKRDRRLKVAIVGTALAAVTAQPTLAGYDIYTNGDTKITFNFDAVAAGFANRDSWFGESKNFLGDDTDNWFEYGFEPRVSFETGLGNGTLFGQLSGVYTATAGEDASGMTIDSDGQSSANTEQANIGWKTSDLFAGLTDEEFSVSIGRQDYKVGSGMLIADGGSDGGEFGGWYLGMRKAFQESAIVRLKTKQWLAELFRIKNRPRGGGTQGEAYGFNGEYTFFETTKVGITYADVDAELDEVDKLEVWSGRLDWTPAGSLTGLAISGEFAHEENDQIESDGWFTQVGYQLQKTAWSPTFSYRYAHFDGDDPDTEVDEGFRSVAYGFSDYGTWYQGEISGNYPLANVNLNSSQFRIKAQPSESVTLNLLYYDFKLDHPESLGAGVTSDDWGDEINFTVDWVATERILVTGVLGNLSPGKAAEQWVGGDKDWLYSMLYVSYTY